MIDKILSQSTAVRTPVLKSVRPFLDTVDCDYDGIASYKTSIVKWLSPVINLSNFHVYPMNGITEGLNWWYNRETRSVTIKSGDYQWVKPKTGTGCIHYLSCPSSIDGNFCDIPDDVPVALDLAYVGTTTVKPIKISDNVEYVFYSLSKSFGIRNVRTGWLFTKTPDAALESLIYGAKYYNYYANDLSEKILENFTIDYVFNTLKHEQKRVCKILNLQPSDSVWLATSTDNEYTKFRRHNDMARLCLSGVYNYES